MAENETLMNGYNRLIPFIPSLRKVPVRLGPCGFKIDRAVLMLFAVFVDKV